MLIAEEMIQCGFSSDEVQSYIEHEKRSLQFSRICEEKSDTIRKFILTRKQQYDNGYPVTMLTQTYLPPNEYQMNRKMFVEETDRSRVCTRCHSTFTVEQCGLQKKSPVMICNDRDGNQYPFHVHDQQPVANLNEFQKAPKVNQYNRHYSGKLYALDVEMVYTSRGQALARVTMVDHLGDVLVDCMVRPADEVYDPVTKYSGLTLEDIKKFRHNWVTARERILSYLNEESILIGHGLYTDLKALKIVHTNVIDTSILFTNGGRRPSLRHLTSVYLGREIQRNGHCSEEDAIASLQLVYFGAWYPQTLAPMYQHLQHLKVVPRRIFK